MFEVKIDEGTVVKMKVTGSMISIASDIIILLHELYNCMAESSNDKSANEFQHLIEEAIKAKIIFGDDDEMFQKIADAINDMNDDVGGDNA